MVDQVVAPSCLHSLRKFHADNTAYLSYRLTHNENFASDIWYGQYADKIVCAGNNVLWTPENWE